MINEAKKDNYFAQIFKLYAFFNGISSQKYNFNPMFVSFFIWL